VLVAARYCGAATTYSLLSPNISNASSRIGRRSGNCERHDLRDARIDTAVAEIVAAYDKHKIMPKDPFGDALHLALASYHRCDFLVTWNCQHLANARKFGHIRRVNGMLGLFVPELVTPMELLGEDWDL